MPLDHDTARACREARFEDRLPEYLRMGTGKHKALLESARSPVGKADELETCGFNLDDFPHVHNEAVRGRKPHHKGFFHLIKPPCGELAVKRQDTRSAFHPELELFHPSNFITFSNNCQVIICDGLISRS